MSIAYKLLFYFFCSTFYQFIIVIALNLLNLYDFDILRIEHCTIGVAVRFGLRLWPHEIYDTYAIQKLRCCILCRRIRSGYHFLYCASLIGEQVAEILAKILTCALCHFGNRLSNSGLCTGDYVCIYRLV